jgi:hypothetical protein
MTDKPPVGRLKCQQQAPSPVFSPYGGRARRPFLPVFVVMKFPECKADNNALVYIRDMHAGKRRGTGGHKKPAFYYPE